MWEKILNFSSPCTLLLSTLDKYLLFLLFLRGFSQQLKPCQLVERKM